MLELTIWTYLLLCMYVALTWWVAARRRPHDPYRRLVLGVVGLMATGAAWMLWALIFPRHHPHASGDIHI